MSAGPPARRSSSARDEVLEAAVHAAPQELASVANNPATASTAAWGGWPSLSASSDHDAKPAPLPAGTLPKVRVEDFARYLRTVGDKLDAFERDKAIAEQWQQQSVSPEDMRARRGQGLVQAMDEVPALYFQEDFDLDRPELWQSLGDIHSDSVRQEALEQLSHHLDAVETYLVHEIAARYDSFFDASAYIQDLGASVHRLYQEVAEMRARVAALEKEAGRGVRVAGSLQRKQANMLATLETLKTMEAVAQAQSALQHIMAGGSGMAVDFAAGIDIMEVLQGSLDNKGLLNLRCFRGLPAQLAGSIQAVDDIMTADFLERAKFTAREACLAAITDRVRAQLAHSNSSEGVAARNSTAAEQQLGANVQKAAGIRLRDVVATLEAAELLRTEWAAPDSVEDVMLPLAAGLQRIARLAPAVKALQEASCEQMREFVGEVIFSCLAVFGYTLDSMHLVAGRAPSTPMDKIPKLASEQFAWLAEAALLAVQAFLHHCSRLGNFLVAALGQVPQQAQGFNIQQATSECCQAVAEVAAARWSKLLATRANPSTSSSRLGELRDVLDMTDVLASLIEVHGVRSVLGLRTALQQLCKVTMESMHQQSISKLTTLLEQEQWAALEVAPQCQRVVDSLQQRQQGDKPQSNGKVANGGADPRVPAPTLQVAGEQFHIVQTQQLLLGMLAEYLAFRDAVPAFSGDVAQRVLELLKIFNSKACQLVLGAGAMQVSGLKSITAKHLAVCCQCVSALAALHPAVVAAFLQGVPHPRVDMLHAGFQRTLQDFEIHCEEICGKLVSMMHERLAANVKQLPVLAASWPSGVPPAASPPAPSSFAATTVKQLQILAGVLKPLLRTSEVRSIMGSIGSQFGSALAEAYDDLQPRGAAWETQMLADLECFLSCLRELPMDPADRQANLSQLAGMHAHRLQRARAAPEQQRPAQREGSTPQHSAALPPAAPSQPATKPVAVRSQHAQQDSDEDPQPPAQPTALLPASVKSAVLSPGAAAEPGASLSGPLVDLPPGLPDVELAALEQGDNAAGSTASEGCDRLGTLPMLT